MSDQPHGCDVAGRPGSSPTAILAVAGLVLIAFAATAYYGLGRRAQQARTRPTEPPPRAATAQLTPPQRIRDDIAGEHVLSLITELAHEPDLRGYALDVAVDLRKPKVVEVLLHAGPPLPGADVQRCLSRAAGMGNVDAVRLLLRAGARGDAPNQFGWPAICDAALNGQTATVKLLLDSGADKEARVTVVGGRKYNPGVGPYDGTGMTPLMLATAWARVDVVRLLLERGAQANARSTMGYSPLGLCRNELNHLPAEHLSPALRPQQESYRAIERLLLRAHATPWRGPTAAADEGKRPRAAN